MEEREDSVPSKRTPLLFNPRTWRLYTDCHNRLAKGNRALFARESSRCPSIRPPNPSRSSNSRTTIGPPSEGTLDPWSATREKRLKDGGNGCSFLSPIL